MASSTEETHAVALAMIEAVRRCGAGAVKVEVAGAHEIDALIAPDAEWWICGAGPVPRSLFLTAHELWAGEPPEPLTFRLDLVSLVVEGDRASIEMEFDTTWDGGRYRTNYHHAIRVSDGKIVSLRQYQDPRGSGKVFKPFTW